MKTSKRMRTIFVIRCFDNMIYLTIYYIQLLYEASFTSRPVIELQGLKPRGLVHSRRDSVSIKIVYGK